jgi:pimeloyl-ACP methyl ester carboxylesterase
MAAIRRDYGYLLGDFRRPRSIYTELRTIINGQRTARQLTAYLDDTAWDDLEDVLAEVLRTCPPIFFYLDAVDEEFSHAPMYWLRCQKGLFYQVMRFLRDPRLGGRLHIVSSIRDIVMSSVYRSEHAPRYYDEPHIRVLSWSQESIAYLLRRKLERLDPSFLMAAGSYADPVDAWLGTPVVRNEARGVHEKVTDYLLRHTRLIPRDVVSMGNAICAEILRQKAAGRSELTQADLRRVVSRSAKRFGDSQLAQTSNQIAADTMPKDAARRGYSEIYTSTMEYLSGIDHQVREIIRNVGRDRFSRRKLELMQLEADEKFDCTTSFPSVLWQNGLLGYVEADGEAHFYSHADMDQFDIPNGRRRLRLPSLRHRHRPDPRRGRPGVPVPARLAAHPAHDSLTCRNAAWFASQRCSEQAIPGPPRAGRSGRRPEGERFDVPAPGGSLAGWSWGDGPPVYLVHGWGGSAGQLGAFVEPLTRAGYQVVAFDGPSHGQSQPGPSGPRSSTILEFAEALRAVAAVHGPAPAVIAHSLGCAATAIAMRDGLTTTRAVFVAPFVDVMPYTHEFARRLGFGEHVRAGMTARIERRLDLPMSTFDLTLLPRRMTPPPLLVVHNREDRETRWPDSRRLSQVWPDARLLTTSGLGHRRILSDPQVVAQVVRFVGGEPRRAGMLDRLSEAAMTSP